MISARPKLHLRLELRAPGPKKDEVPMKASKEPSHARSGLSMADISGEHSSLKGLDEILTFNSENTGSRSLECWRCAEKI